MLHDHDASMGPSAGHPPDARLRCQGLGRSRAFFHDAVLPIVDRVAPAVLR
jgi:hypothetical protein